MKISIITIVKEVKQIHPEYVVMIKSGKFYRVYGKDSYILSYLFQYKIIEETKMPSLGFPANSLKKVESVLENKKINYIVLGRRTNYTIDEKQEFGNLNNYVKIYQISKPYVSNIKRINNIYDYLMKNAKKDDLKIILTKIEKLLY